MDVFRQAVWQVIEEDELLLAELRAIMHQHHQPFPKEGLAFEARTNIVKERILERFRRWLDWLPTLPTPLIGMRLAEEAMKRVQWHLIAAQLQQSCGVAQ